MINLTSVRLLRAALPRYFHSSSSLDNIQKQSKIMNKMLNVKAKRKWYETSANALPTTKSLSRTSREPGKNGSRRVAVLNKLFMKNITDLMSTGSLAREVLGRGLEISKVSITADFRIVNVYWVCGGSARDDETEALLNRAAGALRHELSQLRVMGEVPTIMFIKDEQAAWLLELDRRLARADYGADYQPTEIGHLLKTELTVDTKLSSDIKAKIEQLEESEDPAEDEPALEMTHTVYGLPHASMAGRMRAARRRDRAAWSRPAPPADVVSYRVGADKPACDYQQQREELALFLQKRQIMQDKLHRRLRGAAGELGAALELQSQEMEEEPYEEDYGDEEEVYSAEPSDSSAR